MMQFPDSAEEFMESYKIVDSDEVYTNGAELIPIFRMKQWFAHVPERKVGKWIPVEERLPGEGKDVLICFKEGHDCPHNRLQIAHLGTHDVEDKDLRVIGSERCWYTDQYYYWFKLNMVSAWMPLPEPWKGEEDD